MGGAPSAAREEIRGRSGSWTEAIAALAPWAAATAAFLYFVQYRVRFVGGCDSAAYLVESMRLRGLDAGLAGDPTLPFPGALAPLCTVEAAGGVHSIFPPGFSILLALAGLLRAESCVAAAAVAVGGLALFFLAKRQVGSVIAGSAMIAWYAAPLTFWGATQMMSDYVAAAFVLLAVLAATRRRGLLAGLLLGFAIGVRPTSVLVVPYVVVVLGEGTWRARGRLLLGLVVAGSAWLLFLRISFGSLRAPYASNLEEMTGSAFLGQLRFLVAETALQNVPAAAFAIVGFVRKPRVTLPLLLWAAPFLLLHALWRVPYHAWWQLRFLASATPALYLAAAIGARATWDALGSRALRSPRLRVGAAAAAACVLVAYGTWSAYRSEARWLRTTEFDIRYPRDVERVKAVVPPGAVIGAFEHSIPLRLYGHLQSFQWCHAQAPDLAAAALAQGRSVYAVFRAPGVDVCPERSPLYRARFTFAPVETLPSGAELTKLTMDPGHLPSPDPGP